MAKTASETALLALIYPTAEEDMTSAEREAFERAAELQEEYMTARRPADKTPAGGENRRVRSESIGDVRLEYEYTDTDADGASPEGALYAENRFLSTDGCVICPEAAAVLRCAGLLTRWA